MVEFLVLQRHAKLVLFLPLVHLRLGNHLHGLLASGEGAVDRLEELLNNRPPLHQVLNLLVEEGEPLLVSPLKRLHCLLNHSIKYHVKRSQVCDLNRPVPLAGAAHGQRNLQVQHFIREIFADFLEGLAPTHVCICYSSLEVNSSWAGMVLSNKNNNQIIKVAQGSWSFGWLAGLIIFRWIIMLQYVWLVLLLVLTRSESQQKFVYVSTETVTIERNSMAEFSISLTTKNNEYLSEATILTTLNINQNTSGPATTRYNLIFFDYQSSQGLQCYQDWVNNSSALPTNSCLALIDQNAAFLPSCMNYTDCFDENINYTLRLSESLFKEAFLLLQNTSNDTQLVLLTQIQMELASENTWFYWGVGLTCLLLISLVIYAGIIFYWMLKYKKVKKMFEQFKLTEQEEQVKKEN